MKRSVMTLAVATLCWVAAAHAQNDNLVSLDIKDAPLGDAIKILSENTGIQFILGPDVEPDKRVTISVENKPVERVLDLLIQVAGGLQYEKVEGVYIIRAKQDAAAPGAGMAAPRPGVPAAPRPTAPPAPRPSPGRPTAPAATGATGAEAGTPTVGSSSSYIKIVLLYAYAPGVAEMVGGQSMLYSDIDPWAGSLSGGGGGLGGGLGGGGLGGGLGGGGLGGGGLGGGGLGGGGLGGGGLGGGGLGGGGLGGGGLGGGGFGGGF